jgi:hypothetical protein
MDTFDPIAAYGAALSTLVAIAVTVRFFIERRVWLAIGYSFAGHPDIEDRITIANLKATPVQVSHWRLEWVPRFWQSGMEKTDVTPGGDPDDAGSFTIPGHGSFDLLFGELNKIPTSIHVAKGRKLLLRLYLYGRRWPVKLRVL